MPHRSITSIPYGNESLGRQAGPFAARGRQCVVVAAMRHMAVRAVRVRAVPRPVAAGPVILP